jgi:hypothetical protein
VWVGVCPGKIGFVNFCITCKGSHCGENVRNVIMQVICGYGQYSVPSEFLVDFKVGLTYFPALTGINH